MAITTVAFICSHIRFVSCSFSTFTSQRAKPATPSLHKSRANDRPIPIDAPVITATHPWRSCIFLCFSVCVCEFQPLVFFWGLLLYRNKTSSCISTAARLIFEVGARRTDHHDATFFPSSFSIVSWVTY